jgi:hypothetical protein
MRIRFYRNTSACRLRKGTLPFAGKGRQHLFWIGPVFVLASGRPIRTHV